MKNILLMFNEFLSTDQNKRISGNGSPIIYIYFSLHLHNIGKIVRAMLSLRCFYALGYTI